MEAVEKPRESMVARVSALVQSPFQPFLAGEGLKAKVFRGGIWMGAGSVSEQVTRFGREHDSDQASGSGSLWIMAVVLSAGSLIQMITEMGVKEAIIQNPRGSEHHYLSAAWWLAAFEHSQFTDAYSCSRPGSRKFYGNHELIPLLRVVALAVIFEGTLSSKAYVEIKNMNFRKWAFINHGGGITGVVATVVLSLSYPERLGTRSGQCSRKRHAVGVFLCSFSLSPLAFLGEGSGT